MYNDGVMAKKVEPTMNQKKVFDKVVEQVRNGQKVSISKAMRESGVYSESVSKIPGKITKTKGWKQLMDEHFPVDYIAKKHKQLLDSTVMLQMHFPEYSSDQEIKEVIELAGNKLIKVVISEVTYPGKKGQEDITVVKKIAYYNAPNAIIQDKALDKAYKLRGSYAAEKKDVNVKGLFSLSELASGDFYEEED